MLIILIAYNLLFVNLNANAAEPCFKDFVKKISEGMNKKNIYGDVEWKKFSDAFEVCKKKRIKMEECFPPFINQRLGDGNFYKKVTNCTNSSGILTCDYIDLTPEESENWIQGFISCIQKGYSKENCSNDDYKKFLIDKENVRNNFFKFCKIHYDDCTCDSACETLVKKTEADFKKSYVRNNTTETKTSLSIPKVKDELKNLFRKLNYDKKLPDNYLKSDNLIGKDWREKVIGTLSSCYERKSTTKDICKQVKKYIKSKNKNPQIKYQEIKSCFDNLKSKQAPHGCGPKLISILESFRDGGRKYGNKRNEAFGQGFPNKHGQTNITNTDPNTPYIELDVDFQLPGNINAHWSRGRNRIVYDRETGAVFFTSDHYNTSHFLGCLKKSTGCSRDEVQKSIGKSNTVIDDDILSIGKSLDLKID